MGRRSHPVSARSRRDRLGFLFGPASTCLHHRELWGFCHPPLQGTGFELRLFSPIHLLRASLLSLVPAERILCVFRSEQFAVLFTNTAEQRQFPALKSPVLSYPQQLLPYFICCQHLQLLAEEGESSPRRKFLGSAPLGRESEVLINPTGGCGGRGREPPERASLFCWYVTQLRPESCSSPEPGRPTSPGPTIMMTTAAFVPSLDGKITGACFNVQNLRMVSTLNLLQHHTPTFLHGSNVTPTSGLRIRISLGLGSAWSTRVHQTGNQAGFLLEV